MQRQTWSGMVVAAVLAVSGVVMAQSPASQPATQTPSQQPATQTPSASTPPAAPAAASQADSANRVTVTGCLREASAAPAATSGSAAPAPTDAKGNGAADAKYIVAEATASDSAAGGASASTAKTYQLIANDSALAPHVGKKLEFTGTVEDKEASASGAPRLRVEKASVISADCSAK